MNAAKDDKVQPLSRRGFLAGGGVTIAGVFSSASGERSYGQEPRVPVAVPVPMPVARGANYVECVETHFDRLIHYAMDRFGHTRSAIWMSSLDVGTNELLELESQQAKGDARFIPGAYWYADQPMLVAAHAVATRSACKCYVDSADDYLRSYFHLVGRDRAFNDHLTVYWNAKDDQVHRLPVDIERRLGHAPAWETLWSVDRELTERLIRSCVGSLDVSSHDSPNRFCMAADSLAWLINLKGESCDAGLKQIAESLLGSFATVQVAGKSISPVDRLRLANGRIRLGKALSPNTAATIDETQVKQLRHCLDLVVAEVAVQRQAKGLHVDLAACSAVESMLASVTLLQDPESQAAVDDYIAVLAEKSQQHSAAENDSAKRNSVEYNAEYFGRAIHLFCNASEVLQRPEYLDVAKHWADQSVERLFVEKWGMFRSRIGVDRCDAVDGIGYLMLGLLAIEDDPTTQSAFSF